MQVQNLELIFEKTYSCGDFGRTISSLIFDESADSFLSTGFFSQFGDIEKLRLSRNRKVSVGAPNPFEDLDL